MNRILEKQTALAMIVIIVSGITSTTIFGSFQHRYRRFALASTSVRSRF